MTRQEIHHIALRSEPSPRFQPTGFADLDAAVYNQPRPEWRDHKDVPGRVSAVDG